MARYYEAHIDAGADWFCSVDYTDANGDPIDLTGYIARWTFKNSYSDETALATLTTATDEGLTINVGNIAAHLFKSLSINFADNVNTEGVHDLEIESPEGIVTRLLGGPWFGYPEASKGSS